MVIGSLAAAGIPPPSFPKKQRVYLVFGGHSHCLKNGRPISSLFCFGWKSSFSLWFLLFLLLRDFLIKKPLNFVFGSYLVAGGGAWLCIKSVADKQPFPSSFQSGDGRGRGTDGKTSSSRKIANNWEFIFTHLDLKKNFNLENYFDFFSWCTLSNLFFPSSCLLLLLLLLPLPSPFLFYCSHFCHRRKRKWKGEREEEEREEEEGTPMNCLWTRHQTEGGGGFDKE